MAKKPKEPGAKQAPVVLEGEAVDVTPQDVNPRDDASQDEAPRDGASEPEPESFLKDTPEPLAASDSAGEKADPGPVEEKSPSPETPAAPGESRRGATGAGLLVAGGILAAVLGFAAARYLVPEGWPFPGVTPEPDPLAVMQAEQAQALEQAFARIAALEDRLAAADRKSAEASAALDERLASALAGQEGNARDIAAMRTALTALDTRLLALEKMPRGDSARAAEAAAAAYTRELEAMREMFAAELQRVEDEQLQAQSKGETAQAAAGRAALAKLRAALDAGQPFAAILSDLQVATDLEVPTALTQAAETGVATLAALRESFPDHARAAIEASVREAVDAGEISRISAFFQLQLGTRSLEPREGNDADAVLSRAEAALKQGDLEVVLTELAGLKGAALDEMQGWAGQVESRLAAVRAADALVRAVNGG